MTAGGRETTRSVGMSEASFDRDTARYTYHEVTSWGQERNERGLHAFLDAMVPGLAEGARVVEIGPGRGEFARAVLERGHTYTAIEPSAEVYAMLREAGLDVVRAAVPPLPVDDGEADLVISFDVFEHFQSYREPMRVCRESHRALKPGGRLAVVAPNYDTLRSLFYLYEYQHGFPTNRCRLEELVSDAGFEIERSTAFLTPLGFSSLRSLDRVVAHLALPVARSSLFIALFRGLGLDRLLFRIHKNLCDHVAVVGRKAAP